MKHPYKKHNPHAGVHTYEILADAIILEFTGGKHRYLYNADTPGPEHVAAMQRLAVEGKGLTTYINRHVRDRYAARLPAAKPTRR